MSPDSPRPSRQRRAWRFVSMLGCVLGATGLLFGAVIFRTQAARSERAVCAVAEYANKQAAIIESGDPATGRPPNPEGAAQLRMLASDMRATGIDCPPDK